MMIMMMSGPGAGAPGADRPGTPGCRRESDLARGAIPGRRPVRGPGPAASRGYPAAPPDGPSP